MSSSNYYDTQSTGNGSNDHEEAGQSERTSYMDREVYMAAANGDINKFNSYESDLRLFLTPNKNTILHIFISSRKVGERLKLQWPIEFERRMLEKSISLLIQAISKSGTPFISWRKIGEQLKSQSSIEFVSQILEKCRPLLNQANSKGETPLHLASRFGLEDVVQMLIQCARTPDPIATREVHEHDDIESGVEAKAKEMLRTVSNSDKDTAVHEAVRNNHLPIVRILIAEDPDLVNLANDCGETPLYLAAERGYGDIVTFILENCPSPSYTGPFGRTSLHAAVIREDLAMTRKILEENQTWTKEVDQQGWTPLHHASYLGHQSIVKLLLRYDKSAAYIRDRDGEKTPLHIAALCGRLRHILVAENIISHCPDCCEIVDHRGRNALHFVIESCNLEAVRSLLENPFISNLINQKDDDGNTPLHLLATVGLYGYPLVNHPLADEKAVNKNNLTAFDIFLDSSKKNINSGIFKNFLVLLFSKSNLSNKIEIKSNLRNKIEIKGKIRKKIEIKSNRKEDFKTAEEAQLIVATLVATVTFAAGFTLPGGYSSDKGNDQGLAILSRKLAFKAFLISDTLALVFSTSAVLLQLFWAMRRRSKGVFFVLFSYACDLTVLAVALMVMAFTTGIYAVIPHHTGLGVAVCVLASYYFIVPLFLFFPNVFDYPYTSLLFAMAVKYKRYTVIEG